MEGGRLDPQARAVGQARRGRARVPSVSAFVFLTILPYSFSSQPLRIKGFT